jgi:hypothetical protein
MKRTIWLSAVLLAACSHPAPTTATASRPPTGAYDLAFDAIGCWFGPVWQDALGDPAISRKADTAERCRGVAARVWNGGDEKGHLERLRAIEPEAVGDLVKRVDTLASGELSANERRDLSSLLTATAAAEHENLLARRAADRIKKDLAGERQAGKLAGDEREAIAPLREVAALTKLYRLEAGRYTADAHALGVLAIMDRIVDAGGLSRHFEIEATAPAFALLFGVEPPTVPSDRAAQVAPHEWIEYLTRVAQAAGHSVPDTATRPEQRDRLAWAGMLQGLANRLLEDSPQMSPLLKPVVLGAGRRLEAEAIADKDWFAEERRAQHEQQANLSGAKERGMSNCPSAVTGAVTRAVPLRDGVAVEITAKEPDQVAEIRARAGRQVAYRHRNEAGLPPHTGVGTDSGESGYCPIVVTDTTVSSEEIKGGARITVRPKEKTSVQAVQRMTNERIDALRRTGP